MVPVVVASAVRIHTASQRQRRQQALSTNRAVGHATIMSSAFSSRRSASRPTPTPLRRRRPSSLQQGVGAQRKDVRAISIPLGGEESDLLDAQAADLAYHATQRGAEWSNHRPVDAIGVLEASARRASGVPRSLLPKRPRWRRSRSWACCGARPSSSARIPAPRRAGRGQARCAAPGRRRCLRGRGQVEHGERDHAGRYGRARRCLVTIPASSRGRRGQAGWRPATGAAPTAPGGAA